MRLLDVVRVPVALITGVIGLALTVPAAIVLLPFWVVDAVGRGLARLLGPRTLPWESVIDFEDEVGWRPRPDLDCHVLDFNGDTYHVTTDSRGWRGSGTVEDTDVLVFGDSYAFGCGVDDSDFFASLEPDCRIKAIGSPAYSMVQPLMWMERMAAALSGKLVIWLVYLGNDIEDNLHPALLHYRSPFVRQGADGDWEIFSDHVDRTRWTINSREGDMVGFLDLCSPTLQSVRAFEACDYLIRRAAALCEAEGARLVVLTVPDLSPVSAIALARAQAGRTHASDFDPELPDRKLGESCRSAGVQVVKLSRHLTRDDYLEHDFHWSPKGNRRVAEIIGDLWREHASATDGGASTTTAAPARERKIG
jgi:hypothetical protein